MTPVDTFRGAVARQLSRSGHNEFDVLPHRDVTGNDILSLEHKPCQMTLKPTDIEANWCPWCVGYINKAAKRRGERARRGY